jgi:hypothetical protein
MARDFEDIHDIDDLSDDELRDLVRQHLAAHNGLDPDDISVQVEDGVVHLAGRVGTETERRIAERVVTDVLGIEHVENEIVIDPIRRAESPEAIDDHLADEAAREGLLLGDRAVPLEPSADHLDETLDDEERTFGTTDVQDTIERAVPWIPPESPTPEGLEGTEAAPEDLGEQH